MPRFEKAQRKAIRSNEKSLPQWDGVTLQTVRCAFYPLAGSGYFAFKTSLPCAQRSKHQISVAVIDGKISILRDGDLAITMSNRIPLTGNDQLACGIYIAVFAILFYLK